MPSGQIAPRVFEYVDEVGNTYWSFTRHPQTVQPLKRLTLLSRKGQYLMAFLNEIRMNWPLYTTPTETVEEDEG